MALAEMVVQSRVVMWSDEAGRVDKGHLRPNETLHHLNL